MRRGKFEGQGEIVVTIVRHAALLVTIALSNVAFAAKDGVNDQVRKDLRDVVETFRTSIIKKDKSTFVKLFYGDHVPWLSVKDDAALASAAKDGKTTPKVSAPNGETFSTFIDFVVTERQPIEEKFDGLRISTDGEVAALEFDYVFTIGGRATNSGREMWQLVRTLEGWKIASLIYSSRPR